MEESRNQERSRLEWIKSERERLAHEERVARNRADFTQGSYERVHRDALEKLEEVLAKKEQFEQKIAITSVTRGNRELDGAELEELCRLAGEVPSLWHHPAVTHQERKEIMRCIIDYVVVAGSRERIEATIFWKSGAQTPIALWSIAGRNNLIRELHAQKLTTLEIQQHLAAGKTLTGQAVNLSLDRIRLIQQESEPGVLKKSA